MKFAFNKTFAFLALLFPICSWAANCQSRGIVSIRFDDVTPSSKGVFINNVFVEGKNEIREFSANCARNIVVLVHPKVRFERVFDVMMYANKVGIRLDSKNLHIFIYSEDKSRMMSLPGMGTVKYTENLKDLERVISTDLNKDNFL